jgi:hypothetical protein
MKLGLARKDFIIDTVKELIMERIAKKASKIRWRIINRRLKVMIVITLGLEMNMKILKEML